MSVRNKVHYSWNTISKRQVYLKQHLNLIMFSFINKDFINMQALFTH